MFIVHRTRWMVELEICMPSNFAHHVYSTQSLGFVWSRRAKCHLVGCVVNKKKIELRDLYVVSWAAALWMSAFQSPKIAAASEHEEDKHCESSSVSNSSKLNLKSNQGIRNI